MRIFPALIVAASVAVSLTACAQGPFAPSCDAPLSSGDASSVVAATGKFGSVPSVSFPTPIVTKKSEVSTLIHGTGAELHQGDVAVFQYTLLDGATESILSQSDYTGVGTIVTLGESTTSSVTLGLECTRVGSRVAIASTPADANQAGASNSFIFVVDVLDVFPGKASGTPQIPQEGMPAVVTAPNGAPGITIPKQDPPTSLAVNVLQEGNGKKVEEGNHLVVKYTEVLWSDSSVVDSTWTNGQAKVIAVAESTSTPKGLVKGLVGQRIGSQVLIVIPPSEAFGDAGSNGIPPGSTLVYVVDVLGLAG